MMAYQCVFSEHRKQKNLVSDFLSYRFTESHFFCAFLSYFSFILFLGETISVYESLYEGHDDFSNQMVYLFIPRFLHQQ